MSDHAVLHCPWCGYRYEALVSWNYRTADGGEPICWPVVKHSNAHPCKSLEDKA